MKNMEWISVNDELPEVGKRVLVYHFPRYPIMEGRTHMITNRLVMSPAAKMSGIDENGFLNSSQVTHWMPLPEPPK